MQGSGADRATRFRSSKTKKGSNAWHRENLYLLVALDGRAAFTRSEKLKKPGSPTISIIEDLISPSSGADFVAVGVLLTSLKSRYRAVCR